MVIAGSCGALMRSEVVYTSLAGLVEIGGRLDFTGSCDERE
jgi:hypothetical protein